MNTIIRGYSLIKEVCSNSLFKTYIAEHSVLTGQTLRVTILNETILEHSEVKSEFNSAAFRLSFAEHSNIVKNNDMIEENGVYAILSENIPLNSFANALPAASFDEKKEMFDKILEALIYLNDRKIYHASLSVDNLYIDEQRNPRISNYGFAEIFLKLREPDFREIVLTNLKYLAPELLSIGAAVGEKAEIYSAGRLLNYLFANSTEEKCFAAITQIVRKSTDSNPNKRYRNVKDLLTDFRNCENLVITDDHKMPEQNTEKVSIPADVSPPKQTANQQVNTKESVRNVFNIVNEIEDSKKPEQNSNQANFKATVPNENTSERNTGQRTNNQSDYNKTREAIKQNSVPNTGIPNKSVNTSDVIVFGVLSIIFGFIFSFVGLVLAIIGFSRASNNKKKVLSLKRNFSQSEGNPQSIGIVLCVIGLIISIGKSLVFLGNMFN